jgi:hypothetical protein
LLLSVESALTQHASTKLSSIVAASATARSACVPG